MKTRITALKIGAIVLTIAMGATFIWWRHEAYQARQREQYPWMYPEYQERILAEARVNGEVFKLNGSDGKTYYLVMPGTKSGIVLGAEEIQHWGRFIWESNRDKPVAERGIGTKNARSIIDYSGLRKWEGGRVKVDVTYDEISPGTTAEELMEREKE